jgi:MSHA pilin protein MshD
MARRTPSTDRRRRPTARGLTLAEGLIAASVLAIAVVGIFAPLSATHQQTAAAQERGAGAALAEQLLEEIAAKPYADPSDGSTALGPEAGETTRGLFDNVDDYHGYSDTTSGLTMLDGSAVSRADGLVFARDVTVTYRSTRGGSPTSSGDFALVTVGVTTPHGERISISRMVTRYPLAP